MIPFVDLKAQYRSIEQEINAAISAVLNRGWFILGEEVKVFEEEFANYCGARFGVGVGSGTEALHLALLACGIKPGDEVITVPNTAMPTISAISFANAVPVFVDIDPDSYNMDVSKIEEKITSKTKVILPVHLFGQAADMDPILDIAERHDLKVVEDACQAHGAEYKGKRVGAIGDAGCLSFYPTKNLGAYGDGGMVVTNDEQIAERVQLFRNYGQKKRYYHSIKGFNSRLDEVQAAILRVKLKKLDAWNKARRERAELYGELLTGNDIITPAEMSYGKHVYQLYVIRSKHRDKLQEFLKSKEVNTLIHYPIPVHLQEAYRDLGVGGGSFPKAERYASEILSLPMYPELTDEQIGIICDLIKRFYKQKVDEARKI